MKQAIIIGIILISVIAFGCATPLIGTQGIGTSVIGSTGDAQAHTVVDTAFHPSTGPIGFKIRQTLAENNVDPVTNKSALDHIEVTLQNMIDKDIDNLTVQYIITDLTTGKNESYVARLNGFVLKAHESRTIHFDNKNEPDHFGTNKYGIYYTSQNELEITVTVSADGYQAQTGKTIRGPGGAEVPD